MRILISIFFVSTQILFGQTPSTIVKYELKRKGWDWTPDSVEIIGFVQLDSLKNKYWSELENQISIKASGFMQDYKIDISFNSKDTIGILTSYIYEISQERPNKSDRQKFKDRKITKKEVWILRTKTTFIKTELMDSIIILTQKIQFKDLPTRDYLESNLGVQVDGQRYAIEYVSINKHDRYSVGSVYLEESEMLTSLFPLVNLVKSKIVGENEFDIAYKEGYCYNGSSSLFICR